MHPVIGVVIPAAVLVAVVVVLFMAKPQVSSKILLWSIVVCAVLGLGFYGVAYAQLETSPLSAVIKTVYSLCRIFIGENDYADIAAAKGYDAIWLVATLYLVHAVGLFSTLGAAISALGAAWLQKVRLFFSMGGKVSIIMGVDDNTLTFARNLMEESPQTLLFVDDNPPSEAAEAVEALGGVLFSDQNACALNAAFLKSLRIRAREQITLYVLSDNLAQNMRHARALCNAMQALQIPSEKTVLSAIGSDDDTAHPLLADDTHYGYGSVIMRSREDLAARLLTLAYPPCKHITFDENARATQDFHCVVIGFGQVGQAVLKSLIMNGQFSGSHFRAAVFAPNYTQTIGRLRYECPRLFDQYDIEFFDLDARSIGMFEYLTQHAASIRYVAVCAGSQAANEQIASQLEHFFARQNSTAAVYLCTRRGICHHENREESTTYDVYTPRILSGDRIDRAAMALNHTYCANDLSPQENWKSCDYFSRMSSRASADFAPAFVYAAGLRMEEAKKHWAPQGEVLENLAITEHARWCAFHYCMGFSPMTDEVFDARCQTYLAQKAAGARPLRIGKDLDARIHACLIDWDALDALSAKENAVTGGQVDYKQMDRDNVLTLPCVLQAQE